MNDLHWPSTPAPGAWRQDAACREHPVELFFPLDNCSLKAKAICRECPVIAPCRSYARAYPSLLGIWGGESEKARSRRRWR